jgi:P4 family phage/plasmid primase-like protien
MDIASDIFLGGNHQKQVYFWTGSGDNGKTICQTIIEKMLGPLAVKMSTTVLTGKKVQNGAANPELARLGGGVRLASVEEPNGDEQINIGILKNLSGNDSFYARDLFEKGKEGREVVPLFKIFFICNKLPKLKHSDKAVWNRIRVIPFESTFCRETDPAPLEYEEQLRQKRFPMDKNFASKIPSLLEPFAWLMLKHRQTIRERIEPEKVRAATLVYQKENDVYRQFVEENIVEESGKTLSLVEIYATFKTWYKEGFPNYTLPIKSEVEEYFEKVWGSPSRSKSWKGYKIKSLQDDIENGDAIVMEADDFVDYGSEQSNKCLPPI